jgi:hypothetical protein
MTARFGYPELLKKKYGTLITPSTSNIIKKSTPVNVNATFNITPLKITLPSEPSLATQSKILTEETKINVKSVDNYKYNLLNFIDTSKLIEGRPGFKSKSYYLKELQLLAKKLDLFKNENPKSYFITQIGEAIKQAFGGEPNLIADIKKLTVEEVKKIRNIELLFTKHHITEPTKTELLNKIKVTIKKFYTSDDVLIQQIINTIENEWKL